jgi:hypothetical protein
MFKVLINALILYMNLYIYCNKFHKSFPTNLLHAKKNYKIQQRLIFTIPNKIFITFYDMVYCMQD